MSTSTEACPLTLKIIPLLEQCHLPATLVYERCIPKQNYAGASIFRIGRLLLRFTRDLYTDHLELATDSDQPEFHYWGDIIVVMGWDSLDQLIANNKLEPMEAILPRLKKHLDELENLLVEGRDRLGKARLERTMRQGFLPPSGKA